MIERDNPELLRSSLPDPERYKKKKGVGGAAVFLAEKETVPEEPETDEDSPKELHTK